MNIERNGGGGREDKEIFLDLCSLIFSVDTSRDCTAAREYLLPVLEATAYFGMPKLKQHSRHAVPVNPKQQKQFNGDRMTVGDAVVLRGKRKVQKNRQRPFIFSSTQLGTAPRPVPSPRCLLPAARVCFLLSRFLSDDDIPFPHVFFQVAAALLKDSRVDELVRRGEHCVEH